MSQLACRKLWIDLVQGGCGYESDIYFEDKDIRGRGHGSAPEGLKVAIWKAVEFYKQLQEYI